MGGKLAKSQAGITLVGLLFVATAVQLLAIGAIITYQDKAATELAAWCDVVMSPGDTESDERGTNSDGPSIAMGVSLNYVKRAQANGTYGMLKKGDEIHDLKTGAIYTEDEYAAYVEKKKSETAAKCAGR